MKLAVGGLLSGIVALCLPLLITACDPCFGAVPSCSADPHLTVMGRIVDHRTGRGEEGARMVLHAGPDGQRTASSSTDGSGFYQLSLPADGQSALVSVEVHPPGAQAYEVRGLAVPVQVNRGWAHDLGIWVSRAYYPYIGEMALRCTSRKIERATNVRFRVTPGSGPSELDDNPLGLPIAVDDNGHFRFFDPAVRAEALVPVTGTLSATIGGVRYESGITLPPEYRYKAPESVRQASLAPESTYVGCVYDRYSVQGVGGIAIDFTRTGGARTLQENASTMTDSVGMFALKLGPQSDGPVVGVLTIHAPSPSAPYSRSGVELYAAGDPEAGRTPTFGVGLHLPYFGIVHHGGARVAGAKVTITRTGGATVSPERVETTADNDGQFVFFALRPLEKGTVILDLTVTVPGSTRSYTLAGVVAPVLDEDSQGRLLVQFDLDKAVGPPPATAHRSRP